MVYHLDFVCLMDDLSWAIPELQNDGIQAINLRMVYHLDFMCLMNHLRRSVNHLRRTVSQLQNHLIPLMQNPG